MPSSQSLGRHPPTRTAAATGGGFTHSCGGPAACTALRNSVVVVGGVFWGGGGQRWQQQERGAWVQASGSRLVATPLGPPSSTAAGADTPPGALALTVVPAGHVCAA
jgi:hypothetical protein